MLRDTFTYDQNMIQYYTIIKMLKQKILDISEKIASGRNIVRRKYEATEEIIIEDDQLSKPTMMMYSQTSHVEIIKVIYIRIPSLINEIIGVNIDINTAHMRVMLTCIVALGGGGGGAGRDGWAFQ